MGPRTSFASVCLGSPGPGTAALGHPLGHEGVDVSRQFLHSPSAAPSGELTEPDQHRYTRPDVAAP